MSRIFEFTTWVQGPMHIEFCIIVGHSSIYSSIAFCMSQSFLNFSIEETNNGSGKDYLVSVQLGVHLRVGNGGNICEVQGSKSTG